MATRVQSLFGEVLKTFGTNGELLIKLGEVVLKDENIKEPLFIEIDGLRVPFYIKLFELRGKKAKILFENMESELLAEELLGKKIFWNPVNVKKHTDSELFDIIGFTVEDANLGILGQVSDVFEFPGNPCIEVETTKGKIMIPLNGKIKIKHKQNLIITEIPDGLLDVFFDES